MRPNARTIVVSSLACVLLLSAPLLAKPTRPVSRDTQRRLIAAPSWRETSRMRATHPSANAQFAHRTDKQTHTSLRTRSNIASRPLKQSLLLSHAEARAEAAYVAADPATLNRVHAWELTHRNPPRSTDHSADTAIPEQDEPAPTSNDDAAPTQPLLTDTSNLIRTAPELPRIKSIEEEAATPILLPSLYDLRGRLVVPPPLFGSHEVLLHQNQMANRDGLSRVQDDADLLDLRREKKLVALPTSRELVVDERLPANRRFSRPWTADFLAVLARDFYSSFHEPLQVDSAVRTVEFQRRLLRTNGNAAPATGDTASPHLTGQAVDIAKRGLTLPEIAWMRAYLQPLIEQGKIDVEEEFQQSCFHISVYRNYLPPTPPHVTLAATHQLRPDPSY